VARGRIAGRVARRPALAAGPMRDLDEVFARLSHSRFRRRFTLQSDAPVRVRSRMYKALVKTVGGSELTPISHGISDVTPSPTAGRRNYSIALHAESVRSGTFVLLFRINVEIAFRCRLRGHANRNGRRHQASVALHDVHIFLSERDFHPHG